MILKILFFEIIAVELTDVLIIIIQIVPDKIRKQRALKFNPSKFNIEITCPILNLCYLIINNNYRCK